MIFYFCRGFHSQIGYKILLFDGSKTRIGMFKTVKEAMHCYVEHCNPDETPIVLLFPPRKKDGQITLETLDNSDIDKIRNMLGPSIKDERQYRRLLEATRKGDEENE